MPVILPDVWEPDYEKKLCICITKYLSESSITKDANLKDVLHTIMHETNGHLNPKMVSEIITTYLENC